MNNLNMNSFNLDNFNLDTSMYSFTELENLLNLSSPYTTDALSDKCNALKNKISIMPSLDNSKRGNILLFLNNIRDRLLENLNSQNIYFSGSSSIGTASNISNLNTDNGKLVGTNNFPAGYLNPINIKTIKKAINIDSLFRTNYYNSKSGNYTVTLPERINKIVSMRVSSIQLPLTYHAISPHLENDSFIIQCLDSAGHAVSNGGPFTITLPAGNYETQFSKSLRAADIEAAVNYQLQNSGIPDISNSIGFTVDRISGRSVFALLETASNGIEKIKVTFGMDNDDKPLTFKLGWQLGFRAAEYTGASIVSEGICYITGPRYLFLSINDFQTTANNYFSATYNESIIAPNIIGRINIGSIAESHTIYKSGQDDGFGDSLNRTREYFGPTDIHRLAITLYDEYGRIIDLNYMDWSMVLTFECLYD